MRSLTRISLVLLLLLTSPLAGAQATPSFYVKVDQHWYAVTSGDVAIDAGGNLVDIIGTVLQTSCRRSSGAVPALGTHSALLGNQIFDVLYANDAIRLHATTPPVVEIRTPTGDVSCGAGVTPPQPIVDAVANPPAPGLQPLFANGFES